MPDGSGYIYQLNCSAGGVPKFPVREARLTPDGLVGDRQANSRYHGGPERALCLYALEQIDALRAEGHPIFPGSVGENVTVAKLDWSCLTPGCRLALGDEVIIELSSYTVPCRSIREFFIDGKFKRISQEAHPGESRIYARVIRTGLLAVGQEVRVLNGKRVEETQGDGV